MDKSKLNFLKFAHINLGNARAASAQLSHDILMFNYMVVSLNEPYTVSRKIVGFPLDFYIIQNFDRPRVGLLVNKCLNCVSVYVSNMKNLIWGILELFFSRNF